MMMDYRRVFLLVMALLLVAYAATRMIAWKWFVNSDRKVLDKMFGQSSDHSDIAKQYNTEISLWCSLIALLLAAIY